MNHSPPSSALGQLKVLDLSRVLAGPWATQMLADLGADVIKVERPGAGDDTRSWGPPFFKDAQGHDSDQATYFSACNRNKRAIAVDMAQPEGQALLRQLAAQADVLVENFKVGSLARYGLDWASLHALNPRLIYCSVTGFGQTGPQAQRAGYDLMVQAMSGLMSLTGQADAAPGGGPMRVGVALIDVLTGLYACSAILAAIEARHHSGQGQHIDLALFDVGLATLANQAAGYLNTGVVPQRQGNTHPSLAPYQTLACADGHVLIAVGNDGQFARLSAALGHPEWATDPRWTRNALRVRHRAELVQAIEAVTRGQPAAHWVGLFEDKAVPCGAINDLAAAFAEPQVAARGLIVTQAVEPPMAGPQPPSDAEQNLPFTQAGRAYAATDSIATQPPQDGPLAPPPAGWVRSVASPLRLSATPPVLRRPPPRLGAHTDAVLAELGLNAAQISALRRAAVVG